jgi:tRNA (guanine-N7-)-methyltransferase
MQTQHDGLSGLQPPPHLHRRVTSFRSRRAALTDSQQRTWARLWPQLGAEARLTGSPVDTAAWFGRSVPVVLEIGCGTGTSTAAMAIQEPDVDVVAVEVYKRGLAQLLGAIEREHITNIRLIRGDGLDVLEHMFGTESLTGVRVFFPDPWPKSRHHKRRLLQPGTVELIADRLKRGGILHVATDHEGYAEQIEAVGDGQPRLRRTQPGAGAFPISVRRPTTKYESKAHRAGSAVAELLWEKPSRAQGGEQIEPHR